MRVKVLAVSLILIFVSGNIYGQSKEVLKARNAIESGNPEKARKSLEKYLDGKKGKKDVEAVIVLAKAYYLMALKPEYDASREVLIERSLKNLQKANRKDRNLNYVTEESELFFKANEYALEVADDLRKRQKYQKALNLAKMIADQTGLAGVQVLMAKIEWAKGDTASAKDRLRGNCDRIAEKNTTENFAPPEEQEGFDLLVRIYRALERPDSLLDYGGMRVNIYGTDTKLNADLNWALGKILETRAVDITLLEDIGRWGEYFACDTAFQRLHTAVHLYLFRQAAEAGLDSAASEYIQRFYESKAGIAKRDGLLCLEVGTVFDTLNGQTAINIYHYYARLRREKPALNILGIMAQGNLNYRSKEKINGWAGVMQWLYKERDDWGYLIALQQRLNNRALPKQEERRNTEILARILGKPSNANNRQEQLRAIDIASTHFSKNLDLSAKSKTKIREIILTMLDERNPEGAYRLSKKYEPMLNKEKNWSDLQLEIRTRDFRKNYFETRINEKDSAVRAWLNYLDGAQCKRGNVPETVQLLVQQRINYFRRMAGVPDNVTLSEEKNEACQQAAMVIAQLPRPTHTLSKAMRCYKDNAAEAAKLGTINVGQNLSLGITGIMADLGTQNEAVGNRRWLLFPTATVMGHGSLKTIGVYWLMDEVTSIDSNYYATNPVCWPPAGDVPEMFNFSRWSFSIAGNVENATVTMRSGGKEIPVNQLKPVNGYGLPTLVWEPQRDIIANIKTPVEVEVKSIKAYGKKEPQTIRYTVKFFNPLP